LSFVRFLYRPKNELEKSDRSAAAVTADENEPSELCPNCRKQVPLSIIWGNLHTCSCGYHFRISARQRIGIIADDQTFDEMDQDICALDILSFPGYAQKLETTRNACSEPEAVVCGTADIGGIRCCLFAMEPYFMMGSMGTAVGKK